ncbi:relaxase/mobilization nuclease domain-containing protein [Carboxylicivirga sp. M1479]|uniref:relaxase/mobilization nuclease domain-containing protein n=1 Tax=Carboxylicivirga sp. M1479 TaxID=2594476 RepID=UPI00117842F0|nr:relaxase/mobilization nuclease domain-containing protein [Carboxylicivirga sp. M1479]TRX71139.1 hypothetical protein FNN09_07960 [Carboxylicivirga sp. M1479]
MAIEKGNKRCRNKCFHASINPTNSEIEKLTKDGLKKEIDTFMKHMGYGQQPYFVYEHADIQRTHFHIVSTRIDRNSGKQIKNSNDRYVIQDFIKQINQQYDLVETQSLGNLHLMSSADSPNLKASIQEVFHLLNNSNITDRQEYQDVLKAFNLQLYQSKQGQSILVIDQDSKIVRHSIKLSAFEEKPQYNFKQGHTINSKQQEELKNQAEQILKELIKQYRFYTKEELRRAFLKYNMVPYQISKNGNYNIYSPRHQTVIDAQFLLKKYSVRLKDFTLTKEQFKGIVKDYTAQLLRQNPNLIDAIVDKEESSIAKDKKRIVLKELNLSKSELYKEFMSHINNQQQEVVDKAIQSHFAYLVAKQLQYENSQRAHQLQHTEISFWQRINHQLVIELLNYRDWEHRKSTRQRKKNTIKRRKGRYL